MNPTPTILSLMSRGIYLLIYLLEIRTEIDGGNYEW